VVSLVLNICLLCFKTRYLLKLVNNDRSTIAARSADYLKSRREGSCRARSFKEIEEVATLVSCYNARWVTFRRLSCFGLDLTGANCLKYFPVISKLLHRLLKLQFRVTLVLCFRLKAPTCDHMFVPGRIYSVYVTFVSARVEGRRSLNSIFKIVSSNVYNVSQNMVFKAMKKRYGKFSGLNCFIKTFSTFRKTWHGFPNR